MFPPEQLAEIVKRVFIVKPFYFNVRFESEAIYFTPPVYTDPENDPTWATVRVQMWNGVSNSFRFRFFGAENFENELLYHHQQWLNQVIYEINSLLDFLKNCFPGTTIRSAQVDQDTLEVVVEQLGYRRCRYQIDKNHFRRGDVVYVFQRLLGWIVEDGFQTWHGNDWTLNDSIRHRWTDGRPYWGDRSLRNTWIDNGRYQSEITGRDLIDEFQGLHSLITGELPNSESRRKATELLLNWLSEEQKQSYLENKTFVVIGGETGTKYQIRPDHQINIDVLTGELRGKKLCIVSQTYTPLEDQLLAQKLMIENNEDYFLEIAKIW